MFGTREHHVHIRRRNSVPSVVGAVDEAEERRLKANAETRKLMHKQRRASPYEKLQEYITFLRDRIEDLHEEGVLNFADENIALTELNRIAHSRNPTIPALEKWERDYIFPHATPQHYPYGKAIAGGQGNVPLQILKREQTGKPVNIKTHAKSSVHIVEQNMKDEDDANEREELRQEAEEKEHDRVRHKNRGLDLAGQHTYPVRYKTGGVVKGKKGQAVPIVAHAGELVVPAEVVPKVLKSSAWIDHVKSVQKAQGISYKEAMKMAKGTYKK